MTVQSDSRALDAAIDELSVKPMLVNVKTAKSSAHVSELFQLRSWLEELRELRGKERESSKYAELWKQQEEFMKLLQSERSFPEFPVDITSKQGQRTVEEASFQMMKEVFEAIQHLKNAKNHRATEVTSFDRTAFIEELVDSLHFFIEMCILAGVSQDELHRAYIDKGNVNTSRIREGY